jgi:hypothetical protein
VPAYIDISMRCDDHHSDVKKHSETGGQGFAPVAEERHVSRVHQPSRHNDVQLTQVRRRGYARTLRRGVYAAAFPVTAGRRANSRQHALCLSAPGRLLPVTPETHCTQRHTVVGIATLVGS